MGTNSASITRVSANCNRRFSAINAAQTLSLPEYVSISLPRAQLPEAWGAQLWQQYGRQIAVEFPSPKTEDQWQLSSQGWVGHIPLRPDFHLVLQPKTPLANLFGMWAYAYRLQSWRWLEGLTACESLPQFYEQLAWLLAQQVLARARQGLQHAYAPQTEDLPLVRGQVELAQTLRQPLPIRLSCRYEEHTADIDDNQILAWTLYQVAYSPLLSERTLPAVRRAWRTLHGPVSLRPVAPLECVGRHYDRLNQDYEPLHAVCRFFLEHTGPGHAVGGRAMWPFLVDMARLYELFVAEWLRVHLPASYTLRTQEQVNLDAAGSLRFQIDLVLYHESSQTPVAVLDTKYKTGEQPAAADVAQMVAYAQAKGAPQAILIYPTPLAQPLQTRIGQVQLRALTFALDGDLEQAGRQLLAQLVLV